MMKRLMARRTTNPPAATGMISSLIRGGRREEGGSLVEMALVCAFVYLPMLFGIFQVSYGLYVYNYVCDVAHQATRYAAVRGSNSCIIQSDFINCNLNPTGSTHPLPGTGTPLQNYVQGFGFAGIDPSKLTVTATWYSRSNDNSSGFSNASWTTACTTAGCNAIGNAVQVTVVYQYPLNIPFWKSMTLPITGVSKMMISE
jgi:Flp pilus assembly protein TadG